MLEASMLPGFSDVPVTSHPSLADRFVVPPFSVLDARSGYWQARKAQWLAMGIKSELGREGANRPGSKNDHRDASRKTGRYQGGDVWGYGAPSAGVPASIFDPVLCECIYRWFCPRGGLVIDPFAGGSVRGIVAASLDRRYIGIDLLAAQVEANREQARELGIPDDGRCEWVTGDAMGWLHPAEPALQDTFDLVFTCPPYGTMERYSDDPRDLSTMTPEKFHDALRTIIRLACARLRDDRFAAIVVSNYRDRAHGGVYHDLVGWSIEAFTSAGLSYYNEGVLVTSAGSLPLRLLNQFPSMRKLGRCHQTLLVFLKGDAKRAVLACGSAEIARDLGTGASEREAEIADVSTEPE